MRKLFLARGPALASLWLLLSPVFLPEVAFAQGDGRRSVVAVMPFDFVNAAPDQAAEVTRRVQSELLTLRKFTVVEQSQADEFMKEAAFRQEACTGVPCAQRLGRALGVDKVVTGTVIRKDELHWTLSAELIDVASGRREQTAAFDQEGQFENLMAEGPARVAAKLAEGAAETRTDAPAKATPKTMTDDDFGFHPKRGFALYTGYANYTGKAKLKDGGSLIYSGDAYVSLGLEYQWELSDPWTLAAFLEVSGSSQPSGKLGKIYDSGGPTLGGVELRYWRDRWYVGGNLGSLSTCFFNLEEKRPRTPDLCYYGTAIGVAAGHQWLGGWFFGTSLEYGDLTATEVRGDPRVPKSSSAVEYDWWLNVGYRWGQR